MDKILEKSHDVGVLGVYVYVKDEFAYKDAAMTQPFTATELTEAFLKGAVMVGEYGGVSGMVLATGCMRISPNCVIIAGTAKLTTDEVGHVTNIVAMAYDE